jgi:hypothetical protein
MKLDDALCPIEALGSNPILTNSSREAMPPSQESDLFKCR